MMEDDKMRTLTRELAFDLTNKMQEFWDRHKGMSLEDIFVINSLILSGMIAQVTNLLFLKNCGTEEPFSYIDGVGNKAKEIFAQTRHFFNDLHEEKESMQ
jgi:hypothetical protein